MSSSGQHEDRLRYEIEKMTSAVGQMRQNGLALAGASLIVMTCISNIDLPPVRYNSDLPAHNGAISKRTDAIVSRILSGVEPNRESLEKVAHFYAGLWQTVLLVTLGSSLFAFSVGVLIVRQHPTLPLTEGEDAKIVGLLDNEHENLLNTINKSRRMIRVGTGFAILSFLGGALMMALWGLFGP